MVDQPGSLAATLADLKARRDKLNIAIDALEQLVEGDVAPAATVAGGGVGEHAFFGLSAIDAAKQFLAHTKEPRSATEIADGLERGGFTHQSKNLGSTIYTILKRDEDRDGTVVKVGRKWGLAEWYPGRRGKKPQSTSERLERLSGGAVVVSADADEASDERVNPFEKPPSEPEQPSEQSPSGAAS